MESSAVRSKESARRPPETPPQPDRPWHALEAEEVFSLLETGGKGLSQEEAAGRLQRFGPNQVEQARETPWWKLALHQFQDPLIYLLLGAGVLTLALRDYTDTVVILAVVVLNGAIGFFQELRAQQAMRALAELSAPRAEVVRDGQVRQVESREVVPGDLVVLASGARVPADLRLVWTRDLAVDESALTGESVPAEKGVEALPPDPLVPGDQRNMAFLGTVATRGRARGVAVCTGPATEIGRIARAMREVGQTVTPLQKKVALLGRVVVLLVLVLSAVAFGLGLLRGFAVGEILVTVAAMIVATIPEGLPVVLTLTLAIGVRRMARRNAIIRSLPAVETLGSTTVIGSDKTGTLTRNEMTVRAVWAGGTTFTVEGVGYTPEGRILCDGSPVDPEEEPALRWTLVGGVLANEADAASAAQGKPVGDPTEVALHLAAVRGGLDILALRRDHEELDLLPFEPERRWMATRNRVEDGARVFLKGAPEALLPRCAAMLDRKGDRVPLDAEQVREAAAGLASEGLRVLAVAFREDPPHGLSEDSLSSDLVLAGLAGMEDPVRPEAVDAVADARSAGIRVLMLTGDHVGTARAVGRKLGLGGEEAEAVEGQSLQDMSDEELDRLLERVDIFARVAPEHKLRIVQRLKAGGDVVAVTGDGVNDAPALRAAHLGIAMGAGGTDVAREASAMVLADDNFATITAAVEEGRVVFSNVRKVTFFLLSTGVGAVMTILTSLALGWPVPFVAVQMLWINLVTNGLQDMALAFEPGEPGLLRRRPRGKGEGILTWRLVERLLGVGLVLTLGTLAVFWWALEETGDLDLARSVAMTQMVLFQFFHVFNCRSLDRSIFRIPPLSNRFLFLSFLAALGAQVAVLYVPFLQAVFRTVPLDAKWWAAVCVVGTAVVVGGEVDKWRNRKAGRLLG